MIGLWCNGSTTGFGSVCLGSNPGSPTLEEKTSSDDQWLSELFHLKPIASENSLCLLCIEHKN